MESNAKTQNNPIEPSTNICSKCDDKTRVMQIIISYLYVAQKRGVFTFEESAKIWQLLQIAKST